VLTKGRMREEMDVTNGGMTYTYKVESVGEFTPQDIEELALAFTDDELDELRTSVTLELEYALQRRG